MAWNNNRYYYGRRKYNKTAARLSYMVCGLLFVVFSMVYLTVFQKDLIEALHLSTAKENSEFKILPAAIIVTVILMILKWGLNLLMRLRGSVHALAYIPSFLGLVTMTAFGRDVYMGESRYIWWWLMPVLTAVFVTVTVAVRKHMKPETNERSTLGIVINNIALMLIMCVGTMCLGNTDRYFHNELRMESLISEGNNMEVLKVAGKSSKTTRTMTALRMMAMAKEGKTGEWLFRFPQYFKSEGMFFDSDSMKTLRFTNDSVYALLGDRPAAGESRMQYLKRLSIEGGDSCRMAVDYYLAGLMLDKKMDEFAEAIVKTSDTGRYYREAILMYKEMNPQWEYVAADNDSTYLSRLKEYRDKQRNIKYKSETEERNRMKLEFGDTFWWYYDYQK